MKTRNPAKVSKRMRRLTAAQVQEYVDRYYPPWGKAEVDISPCGTFAGVRSKPKRKRR